MSSLVPYKPDMEAWKEHFKHTQDQKRFYPLKVPKHKSVESSNPIQVKLVTPVQQAVEQAQSEMKEEKKKKRKNRKMNKPWNV